MSFSRGANTLHIAVGLFIKNRKRLIDALRKVAPAESIVLLQGGIEKDRYNTDATDAPFRQESYFFWAFGSHESDCYGALELDTGRSILFPPKLDPTFAVWNGKIETENWFKDCYKVDEVHFHEKNVVAEKLIEMKPKKLLLLRAYHGRTKQWLEPADFPGKEKFDVDTDILYPIMADLRMLKTDQELSVMRYASKITTDAHKELMKHIRPGMYEYQMESLFKHVAYFSGGCRYLAYTCVAASGSNSAILHYGGPSAPNSKMIFDGELCLFDMGAEYNCYASDVTCSFPANGKFSENQSIIYNAVLKANRAVFHAAKPGVLYSDMRNVALSSLLTDMKEAGMLQGDVDEMMQAKLGTIFMPHGLGHLIGLDVHDVYGTENSSLERRPLEERMVITIEPGIYFIDKLLDKALGTPELSKFIVTKRLDQFRGFGGVRIEDVVVIWADGNENISHDIPRTIDEIESFMSTGSYKSYESKRSPKRWWPGRWWISKKRANK